MFPFALAVTALLDGNPVRGPLFALVTSPVLALRSAVSPEVAGWQSTKRREKARRDKLRADRAGDVD
jgi:hypothetical protein